MHKHNTQQFTLTVAMLMLGIMCIGARVFALTIENPLGSDDLMALVNKILDFLFTLSIPLVSGIVLYGGITMITSGGDAAKFKKGWTIILYAAIGFGVLLLAKGIGSIVINLLTGNSACTEGESSCSSCGTGMVQEGQCINGQWQHIGSCHTGSCAI